MGQAKRRGSAEQRAQQAIEEGRVKQPPPEKPKPMRGLMSNEELGSETALVLALGAIGNRQKKIQQQVSKRQAADKRRGVDSVDLIL